MKKKPLSKLEKLQYLSHIITYILAAVATTFSLRFFGVYIYDTPALKILNPVTLLIVIYLTTLNGYITSIIFCSAFFLIYSANHGIVNSYMIFILMIASLITFLPIQNKWYKSGGKTVLSIFISSFVYGVFWPVCFFITEEVEFSFFALGVNYVCITSCLIVHGLLTYLFFNKVPRKIQKYFYCGRYYLAEKDNFFYNVTHGKKARLPQKVSLMLILEAIVLTLGATLFANLLLCLCLTKNILVRYQRLYLTFNMRFIFLTSSLAFPILILLNQFAFKNFSKPIILISKAMEIFTKNTLGESEDNSVEIDLLDIHTHDEIEELFNTVKQTSVQLTGYIEEMKYEQQLEEDLKIAQEANKAKSQFLSNMSHEIRTPINAILGLNEMILRESKNPEILSYARDDRSSSRSLLALVNDILDFSKIEAGKMEIIPTQYELASLINDLLNMTSLRAKEKHIDFNVNVDPNIPSILYGDEIRIRQCVVNILTNAVKYTKKGSITLNVFFNPISFNQINLKFQVIDTGVGIKNDDMEKLFSPFERIEEEHNRTIEGTGLGMNIVKSTLKLMHSHLEVKSEYGKGSDFSFGVQQIILSHDPIGDFSKMYAETQESENDFHDSFTAPEAKILFVDDTPINLKVVRALLKRTEIQISTCESGAQCIELAKSQKFHIIFIDYRMPEMDGIETLHNLKNLSTNLNKDIPYIMLTANAVSGARELYLNSGFNDYLAKPIDVKKMEEMIKFYLPKELIGPPPAVEEIDDSNTKLSIKTKIALQNKLSNQSNFISLEGIDMAQAITNCGSKEILEEAFIDYQRGIETRVLKLRAYLSAKDYKNYTVQVHALKSTSRLIGAVELSEKAAYLEKCCDSGKYDEVVKKTPALLELYLSYIDKLKPVIPVEKSDKLKPLTMAHYKEALSCIKESVMAFDFDTADVIAKDVDSFSIPMEIKAQWELIKAQIKNVDQAQVLDLLKDI